MRERERETNAQYSDALTEREKTREIEIVVLWFCNFVTLLWKN